MGGMEVEGEVVTEVECVAKVANQKFAISVWVVDARAC